MKRLLCFATVFGFFLVLPVSHAPTTSVIGVPKGHVPVDKVQVCHRSNLAQVITVSENALQAHLNHGDCEVPACDFNNVFHTGDSCDNLTGSGGQCSGLNPRDSASGVTPGCPAGKF